MTPDQFAQLIEALRGIQWALTGISVMLVVAILVK